MPMQNNPYISIRSSDSKLELNVPKIHGITLDQKATFYLMVKKSHYGTVLTARENKIQRHLQLTRSNNYEIIGVMKS